MPLSGIFLGLGQDTTKQLLRSVSVGRLKTYQIFDRVKTRLHTPKLNQEALLKLGPRVWTRLNDHEEDLALDLAQAILVSHLDLIVAVLDFLEIPHTDGFFEKETDIAARLADGWQQRVLDQFQDRFPNALLLFYVNHLAHEVDENAPLFVPGGSA